MAQILRRHADLPPAPEGVRRLVRYENRKIYDPTKNSYITFHDLLEMAVEGQRFEVRHSLSGALQTTIVLAAMLARMAKLGTFASDEMLWGFVRECATIEHEVDADNALESSAMFEPQAVEMEPIQEDDVPPPIIDGDDSL